MQSVEHEPQTCNTGSTNENDEQNLTHAHRLDVFIHELEDYHDNIVTPSQFLAAKKKEDGRSHPLRSLFLDREHGNDAQVSAEELEAAVDLLWRDSHASKQILRKWLGLDSKEHNAWTARSGGSEGKVSSSGDTESGENGKRERKQSGWPMGLGGDEPTAQLQRRLRFS